MGQLGLLVMIKLELHFGRHFHCNDMSDVGGKAASFKSKTARGSIDLGLFLSLDQS